MSGVRHLVTVDDLSLSEIRSLFEQAKRFSEDLSAWSELCRGRISASLFYEPSTRTRLSFESAMLRLGGGVLTAADMESSSATKGESLADTVRVVGGGYADVIVLRHPSEGAARLAADFSPVPVINAGDGSHEHPTQTLCDLYNLWVERGGIEGLDVVLAGDLKYSRTVHSFAYALARFGANIVCVPQPGFEMPGYVLERLREEFDVEPVAADVTGLGRLAQEKDAIYLTPQKPHQLSLFTDSRSWEVEQVDAVYMTRPQTERHGAGDQAPDLTETQYLRIERGSMSAKPLRDAVVMHPLPRRDEIASDMDDDPRAIYFKQTARGVPIRMAILAWLLGRIDVGSSDTAPSSPAVAHRLEAGPNPCPNPSCISRTEPRHVAPSFRIVERDPLRVRCGYCTHDVHFRFVGCSSTRVFHAADAAVLKIVQDDHLVFFADRSAAEEHGFTAAQSAAPSP